MHLISLLMCATFEDNPITTFCFMAVFASVWKKKKKKKTSDFSKAYISGITGTICFRSGMCSLPICWHLHRNLVLFGQETTELRTCVKSYFVPRGNIITLCTHAPFSWATRHTTVCLDCLMPHGVGLCDSKISIISSIILIIAKTTSAGMKYIYSL